MGESITFDDEDADGLTVPHEDTVVITLHILDTDIKWVLVD